MLIFEYPKSGEMIKKAIILDLDNTIYPVSSIGDKLFKSLFELIKSRGEYSGNFERIRYEIMRRPFQFVAKEFSFSESLFNDGMMLLQDLTFGEPMLPFEDYKEMKDITILKFLVTVGFTKLQKSKIRQLNIENDFEAIFIIDPVKTRLSKKEIFLKILHENAFDENDLIVVGDDVNSEIKAGKETGIDTVLYDREGKHSGMENQTIISNFKELKEYL